MKLIFIILLSQSLLLAQSGNVSGHVRDSYFNSQISSVIINIVDASTGLLLASGTTDTMGHYSINYTITGINGSGQILPDSYHLSHAYPNPFNPTTRLNFTCPASGKFTVQVYNILGKSLNDKDFSLSQGNYSFEVKGLGSAGIYFFRIEGNNINLVQKLMLLDGGHASNVDVILLSGSSNLSLTKTSTDNINVTFTKSGYKEKDTVLIYQANISLDASLDQIPKNTTSDVSVHVTNKQTGENVPNAAVKVTDSSGKDLGNTNTNTSGDANAKINYTYISMNDSTKNSIDAENVSISKAGYNPSTINEAVKDSISIDNKLDKIPFNVSFTMNAYYLIGGVASKAGLKFLGPDSVRTFPVNASGQIKVNFSVYKDSFNKDVKILNTNTKDFNPYITIRRIHQKWTQMNIAENGIAGDPNIVPYSYSNLPDTVVVNLDTLNQIKNMNVFFEHMYLPLENFPGRYISTMSDTVQSMILSVRPGRYGTSKWLPTATRPILTIFNSETFDDAAGDSSKPLTEAEIALPEQLADSVLQYSVNFVGDTLLKSQIIRIYSFNDPKFLSGYKNNNFYNSCYIEQADVPTPGNFLEINYSTGQNIDGFAQFNSYESTNNKASEIYSFLSGNEDAFTGDDIGGYALKYKTLPNNVTISVPTKLGIYMLYKQWMSDPKRRVE